MPLPLTVWQITARGRLPGVATLAPSALRRSSTSWPLHSETSKPKLDHLSANGSMLWISNTLPAQIIWGGLAAGVIFLGAFGFVAALEFFPAFGEFLGRMITRFAPEKVAGKLHSVLEAFIGGVRCLRSFKHLLIVFSTSLVVWGIEGTTYSLVGRAFGMELPLTAFFVTMVFVNLASIVPSAPGQFGTFQLFCVTALGMFGVSAAQGLSYGLVLNVAEYLPVTLLGILFLTLENLSFKTVMHPDQEPEESPPPVEGSAARAV